MSLMCGCEEGPEVFSARMVRARKQYKCCECCNLIPIGEVYEYIFGVWEGEVSTFHTCEKCSDLRASMTDLGFCGEFGDLLSEHKEYLAEYAPPKLTTEDV